MSFSSWFVRRPIATVLLTSGVALSGVAGFFVLPVSPLPQVDFPVISVSANLPGASPETMASSVATPLERRLGIISDVNEMTSNSGTGNARVSLQFNLNRNIDGAAREVQAAINAARADLPATLRSNPTYRKANPADAPIMILAITSKTRTPGQIYDSVANVVQQHLAQAKGVGDVEIGGGSLPAVRVELIPFALNKLGISMEDVRAAIQASHANRPKGAVEGNGQHFQVYTSQPGRMAADYKSLIVAWRDNAPVRLQDVANVIDSVEDTRTLGLFNGEPAIVAVVTRQPGANVIQTVDSVKALLPELRAQLPADVELQLASDSTVSIRSALREIELTLVISLILVVLVVSAFLRTARATVVPAVATIVSLLGTFGIMYLLGFSLNNLSLMALTVATGFVVDDAIVVLENTSRHIEAGMNRIQAALLGAREVGFTVLSMSVSLVAVFIPLLFMGGQVGRLFREFAVTLSVAVLISLVISLTTTPMMCAMLLKRPGSEAGGPGRISRWADAIFRKILRGYERSLDWALAARPLVMLILLVVIGLNIYLFMSIPKGFFPQQDTGQLNGGLRADQSISFRAMREKLRTFVNIIHRDPAVATVVGFTGGSRAGGGFLFINLKPRSERKESGQQVIARLRPQLSRVTGASLFLNPVQDVRMGGRQSNSTYQYTLKSDNSQMLRTWAAKLAEEMKNETALTDIDTDQEEHGVETFVDVDRLAASRLGVSALQVDNALYDSFGQRQVATIYEELNQYHVIMEVDPAYAQTPAALQDVYVPTTRSARDASSLSTAKGTFIASSVAATTPAGGGSQGGTGGGGGSTAGNAGGPAGGASGDSGASTTSGVAAAAASAMINPGLRDSSTGTPLSTAVTTMAPLSAMAKFGERATATSVRHQDSELATTISFNLSDGYSLSDAAKAIHHAEDLIRMPTTVRGSFEGTARSFQEQNSQQPLLILAAILVIYIILGILYESTIHPITVLSTLPSAGFGAVVALMIFKMEFSIIALIGVFLLIGIVKKNAILIIDFALEAERARGVDAIAAVREACLLRFRPILMTTAAAVLGALPLAIGFGEGSETRQPLGVAIIGGLIASQLLTLLTTPVVYVYLDKMRKRSDHERELSRAHSEMTPSMP